MIKSHRYTNRFTWIGAIFGLAFPLAAFVIRAVQHGMNEAFRMALSDPLLWIIASAPFFLGAFARFAGVRQDRLMEQIAESNALSEQLKNLVQNLEQRISERANLVQKRAAQLQTAGEIARDILTARDVDEVLTLAVNLIRERFGYFHAGIFLADDKFEYAVLQAATGEAGQAMLQNNHRLKIGETGIVGYVMSNGTPRVALDVTADKTYFSNPLLPLTRSEMALPLKVAGNVIGALDVQSVNPAAFSQDDITTIQTMADQLASAIDKARLLQALEQKTHELETSQRQLAATDWQSFLARSRRGMGFRYRQNRLTESADQPLEARQALIERRPVIQSIPGQQTGTPDGTSLAVPVIIREQVVGTLNLRFSVASIDQTTIRLIENIASRVALALENARLLEENQRRAEREHKVGEITAKVRASTDIDRILRTAIEELGRTLGATQATIQLNTEEVQTERS